MTDETTPSETPEDTTDTQADSGAVDPATRIADSVDKEYRSLDDFPAELRSKVEDFSRRSASKAVNEALTTKREKGEFLTQDDLDNALKQRDEQWSRKQELQQHMEKTLIQEHGIAVGSPEYDKFAEASQDFKATALQSREGIAKIVRAAGIRNEKEAAAPTERPVHPLYQPRASSGEPLDIPATGLPLAKLNPSDD